MSSKRHEERISLGSAAVLPLTVAAALLPVADCKARRWIRERGLVRNLVGKEVVVWVDIVDALREEPDGPDGFAAASLPRVEL